MSVWTSEKLEGWGKCSSNAEGIGWMYTWCEGRAYDRKCCVLVVFAAIPGVVSFSV